jgi:hypothetical protein
LLFLIDLCGGLIDLQVCCHGAIKGLLSLSQLDIRNATGLDTNNLTQRLLPLILWRLSNQMSLEKLVDILFDPLIQINDLTI